MTKQTEALKMAIEAIERAEEVDWDLNSLHVLNILQAIQACKEALEQPAQEPVACHCGNPTFNLQSITHTKLKCFEQTTQEPVAWTDKHNLFLEWDKESLCYKAVCKDHEAIPFYTHPAPSWQGLSDDELDEMSNSHLEYDMDLSRMDDFARAIEAKIKEKNT